MNQETVRFLLIEYLSSDAELIRRELQNLGFPFDLHVVQDDSDLRRELREYRPDIVLSDYMMPRFTGMEALKIVRQFDDEMPFIIVTGSMNELTAVECMKAGAWDYVIKEKLSKLVPSILSALNKKELIAEKKSALKALKESEQRFRTLLESAPLAIVVHLDQQIYYGNDKAIELAGANDLEDFIGRNIMDFIHPDFVEVVKDRFALGFAGEILETTELKFINLKRREIYVEITSMLIDLDERPAFISIINDISERKQAMARYQSLVEQSNDAIYLLFQNKFELINRRFTELFGYTLDECNQTDFNFFHLIAPESRKDIQTRMQAVERGEDVPSLYEFTAVSKDGRRIICETSVSYIDYEGGKATQGVIRDITERRKAEEEIRKLSQAVEQSPASVVITDPDGNIEYVNPAFTKISGYSSAEAIGQNPRILKSGQTSMDTYVELWATIKTGKIWTGEFVNMKKDGSLYWEKAIISPIFNPNGQITHFLAIKDDVTQTKQLEEQFRQAQKMEAVGQLAGGVAHDFNNLLTIINGYCELALAKMGRDDPVFEKLQQIKEAGYRAGSLTRQLLAFSRKQIMKPEILNLNLLLKNMEKMLRRLIGEDIDFITIFTENLGLIKADAGQIEQVVLNLAINARDAMPDGGTITIETMNVELSPEYVALHKEAEAGWFAMLAVSDTGVGMEPEITEHIFEPFFTTKERGRGTGLGLSTVYGIVKQSGGSIWVYSEPGKGTTFKIYFPLIEEFEKDDKTLSALEPKVSGSETILIAEDEKAVRLLAADGLRDFGYTILEAQNKEEALELAEKHAGSIHLLLTDIIMPGGSGGELAVELHAKYPALKVLFMSGYTDESVVTHGMLIEKTNFIQKPFSLKTLAQKVREVLDNAS